MNHSIMNAVEDIYSLTPLQEGMLFHHLADEDSTNYIAQDVYSLQMDMDEEICKQSLQLLAQKYPVLKTCILYENISVPRQVVLKKREIEYTSVVLNTGEDDNVKIDTIIQNDIQRRFNLQKDALIRVAYIKCGNRRLLLWTYHHIILDGWSSSIVLNDFVALYARMIKGEKEYDIRLEIDEWKRNTLSYGNYVKWVRNKKNEASAAYWKEYTADYEGEANIRPTGIPNLTDEQVVRIETFLPVDTFAMLQDIAMAMNVTINNIVEAAWGILLQKYNNENDVIFGKVVSGRNAGLDGIENLVGLCINTIPLRVKSMEATSIGDLIQDIKNAGLDSSDHEFYPLANIQRYHDKQGGKLINTLFVFENYDHSSTRNDPGIGSMYMVRTFNQSNYRISFNPAIRSETLRLSLKYDPSYYSDRDAQRILAHLVMVLTKIATAPDAKVSDIEILTKEEMNMILGSFNDTYKDYARAKTLLDLFEEQVRRTPDNTAFSYGEETITYKELNIRANRIAWQLRAMGIKPDDFVAIQARQSTEMVVGVYGILKSGGAYIPIDHQAPFERKRYMVEACSAKCMLVYGIADGEYGIPIIRLDEDTLKNGIEDNPERFSGAENYMYCIFTSGTTGIPKAVAVRYRNVTNLLLWYKEEITEDDRVLLLTPLHFDMSVRNLFSPHLTGAAVYCCGIEGEFDAAQAVKCIQASKITMIGCTVTMFNVLVQYDSENNYKCLESLRRVFLGGEELKYAVIEKFIQSNRQVVISNLYGPTEDAGCAVAYTLRDGDGLRERVPIGKPISNKQVYIMADGKLCGIGEIGEITICGEGVTDGYLNDKDLKLTKFVKNLFGAGSMYRSGDFGRWLPDGNIECFGRTDDQVKVRGVRIELGEIETALRSLEEVHDCAVVVRKDEQNVICAYVVGKEGCDIIGIRGKLTQILPRYMVPAYIIQIDTIPLTRNGKLDKRAFPSPYKTAINNTVYVPPSTSLEIAVAEIIRNVLNVKSIGMEDNIFDLGADSIKVTIIKNQMEHSGYKINIRDIINAHKVDEICKHINRSRKIRIV